MFKAINHILFEKPSAEIDPEELENFTPYMVCRYLSFYGNSQYVDYANNTLNKYSGIFKTDEELFKFYEHIVPKLKKTKINYVKKIKKEKVAIEKNITEFSSRREMNMLTNLDM